MEEDLLDDVVPDDKGRNSDVLATGGASTARPAAALRETPERMEVDAAAGGKSAKSMKVAFGSQN